MRGRSAPLARRLPAYLAPPDPVSATGAPPCKIGSRHELKSRFHSGMGIGYGSTLWAQAQASDAVRGAVGSTRIQIRGNNKKRGLSDLLF